jgi:hypothetical protein
MPGPRLVSTSDYRRQARRLRGALANQPGRLHYKLRELARRHDSAQAPNTCPAAPVPRRAEAFAAEVAASLDGAILRYSQRRALMATARRLGMGDFEANLVIAAVQHERRGDHSAGVAKHNVQRRLRLPDLSPLLVVIAIESLVGLGIWHVCFA